MMPGYFVILLRIGLAHMVERPVRTLLTIVGVALGNGCMHKLDPDLWISDGMWAAVGPVTPYEALPLPRAEKTARADVEAYA